jgi:hypothetical protein
MTGGDARRHSPRCCASRSFDAGVPITGGIVGAADVSHGVKLKGG